MQRHNFFRRFNFWRQASPQGESPFWTPFVFSGHPQIADPQSLIFSPPYSASRGARRQADGMGRRRDAPCDDPLRRCRDDAVARRQGLASGRALVVTALSFAFGAAMAWRIQHVGQVLSLCYLPIVLLLTRSGARPAIDTLRSRCRPRRGGPRSRSRPGCSARDLFSNWTHCLPRIERSRPHGGNQGRDATARGRRGRRAPS